MAIKLVDAEAIIIKNKAITVIIKLLYLPTISVGFVKILSISSNFWFKKTSAPETMKTANTENKIRSSNKVKFPFFKFLSFLI